MRLLRSAPTFLAFAVLAQVTFNTDTLVIAHYLGPTAVVPYATGFSAAMSAAALVYSAVHPFWPGFARAVSRGDFAWIQKRFAQLWVGSVLGAVFLEGTLVVLGPSLFRAWVGPAATPSRWLFFLFGVYLVVQASTLTCFMLLAGTAAVKGLGRFAVMEVALNLGLSLLLVPRIGTSGAALSTVLATLASTGVVVPYRGIRTLQQLSAVDSSK